MTWWHDLVARLRPDRAASDVRAARQAEAARQQARAEEQLRALRARLLHLEAEQFVHEADDDERRDR